ncbi:hypothetical protein E2C01_059898 [Portunus trituberculatus]|uniref:Uncharacterized protein n=1 Tax=Portunus trituberculatus TaxID=210409 RepID=A0A5B7H3V6_PORTR|nr:hypothetical protein [Portunus trituberculatus]
MSVVSFVTLRDGLHYTTKPLIPVRCGVVHYCVHCLASPPLPSKQSLSQRKLSRKFFKESNVFFFLIPCTRQASVDASLTRKLKSLFRFHSQVSSG